MGAWLKRVASVVFTIDSGLAVVLSANAIIEQYLHSYLPEYATVASAVLAGLSIFVAVSAKIATVLANASVQKASLAAGQKKAA